MATHSQDFLILPAVGRQVSKLSSTKQVLSPLDFLYHLNVFKEDISAELFDAYKALR